VLLVTGARWLDDEEQESWLALLQAMRTLLSALDRQLLADAGMPHAYYMILAMLSAQGGRARMNELAASVDGSQSRVSHAVTRLEEVGWVRRERCATDLRGWEAVLTDAGQQALADAAPGHVDCVRAVVFDRISRAQVRQLKDIGTAIGRPVEDL
jgi:DNA-binding MarR family transcriptional regulator